MIFGVFLILAWIIVPFMNGAAQEFRVISEPDSAPNDSGLKPIKERVKRGYTTDEISKAYMNCLIDVDSTIAELAKKAEAKVVQYEMESQRGFCEKRKRGCNKDSTAADCQTFMEEFVNVKVLE
jgi:hypothetical protein